MSQESADVVRRLYEATRLGDVEAFLTLHAPDATVIPLILDIEGGGYSGHQGIRRFWEEIHSAFPDWHWEAEGIRTFDDVALVDVHIRGVGTGSGVSIDQRAWHAIKVRDGKVTWWRVCRTESEALEAAGLAE